MMKFLVQVALLLVATTASVSGAGAAPNYRIQSTTYAVSIASLMDSKNTNCRNTFGEGSKMAEWSDIKTDFASALPEFNEALVGVFFKNPQASFFVAYKGKDSPQASSAGSSKTTNYVLRNGQFTKSSDILDTFGNAKLATSKKQHQVLCAVPIDGGDDNNAGVSGGGGDGGDGDKTAAAVKTPKPYKSPDDTSNSGSSGSGKSSWIGKTLIVMSLVGIALVMIQKRRNQFNIIGMRQPGSNSSLNRGYYSVLDPQKTSGPTIGGSGDSDDHFMAPGDLSLSLCSPPAPPGQEAEQGMGMASSCEMGSYNNPTTLPPQQPQV